MWPNYDIKEDQGKYVIYKGYHALHLPCKMVKKKRVEFDTEEEARKYIEDVYKLIENGNEYIERF